MCEDCDANIPQYDREELFKLLCQVENLQHQRIYYFLVAETIFFAAAGSALKVPFILFVLAFSGLSTALLFTLTNVKLYWRLLWLLRCLKKVSPLFDDYMTFRSFHTCVALGDWEHSFKDWLTHQAQGDRRPRFLDTGWLYTWGIFFIVVITWLSFIGYEIFVLCFPSDHVA
jgi:hypothetical protein